MSNQVGPAGLGGLLVLFIVLRSSNTLSVAACGNNTFGQNCAQHCSRNCAGTNKSCDHRNGACIQGCVNGFKEPNCNEEYGTENIMDLSEGVVSANLMIAVPVCMGLILFCLLNYGGHTKRKSSNRPSFHRGLGEVYKERRVAGPPRVITVNYKKKSSVKKSDNKNNVIDSSVSIAQPSSVESLSSSDSSDSGTSSTG